MDSIYSREEVAAIYQRHIVMVYQICLVLLKHVPDAEDAAQEVFRKVLELKKPFQSPEHEKAWLIVAARNECKNQLKHWWRTHRADPEVLSKLACPPPEEGKEELRRLIWELPEKYRLALYLHYYQGYTTQEMGELLGRDPATVRAWLFRGRKKLKLRLEEEKLYGDF